MGIVVKASENAGRSAFALTEFSNLADLHARLPPVQEFRVPRPLDCLPEFNAIVLERVFGPRLDAVIRADTRRLRRDREAAATQCRQAGRWLRAVLPRATGGSEAGRANAAFRRALQEELGRMLERASRNGLPTGVAQDLRDRLSKPQRDGHALVRVHSDYTPYNILVASNALYVTDFAEMPDGCAEGAAAFFWSWLELAKQHPLLTVGALVRCQEAFQEGFGAVLPPFWHLWGMLRHASYFPRADAVALGPRRWWRRWRTARIHAWLAAEVRRS